MVCGKSFTVTAALSDHKVPVAVANPRQVRDFARALGRRLRDLAPGLTPRSVLEKLATIQMLDVHLPTTDAREVILTRYTQPEPDQQLVLEKLKLKLPDQSPPKITSSQVRAN